MLDYSPQLQDLGVPAWIAPLEPLELLLNERLVGGDCDLMLLFLAISRSLINDRFMLAERRACMQAYMHIFISNND